MRNPTSSVNSTSSSVQGCNNRTTPCCSKVGLKRGPWTPEEDDLLSSYIKREGEGRWRTLPKRAGLLRCGKSCRLRWMNYLRPSVKRGHIAPDEEDLILRLHRLLGNRWSLIAGRIPGRTDNEIKNYWNTHLSKKLISQGIDPRTHKPLSSSPSSPSTNPNNDINTANTNMQSAASSSKQPNLLQSDEGSNPNNPNVDLPLAPAFMEPAEENENNNVHYALNNEEEDNADDININTYQSDEGFSSFLNSLINDDFFHNGSQNLVLPDHHGANSIASDLLIPVSSQLFTFGADGWDVPIMSSADAAIINQHDHPKNFNEDAEKHL